MLTAARTLARSGRKEEQRQLPTPEALLPIDRAGAHVIRVSSPGCDGEDSRSSHPLGAARCEIEVIEGARVRCGRGGGGDGHEDVVVPPAAVVSAVVGRRGAENILRRDRDDPPPTRNGDARL